MPPDGQLPGLRHNTGKPRVDLVPPSLMIAVGTVAGFGALKYAPRNWERGMEYSRVYSSLLRHLMAWWQGEDKDAESGLPHLWLATWNAAALVELSRRVEESTLTEKADDRPHRFLAAQAEKEAAAAKEPPTGWRGYLRSIWAAVVVMLYGLIGFTLGVIIGGSI